MGWMPFHDVTTCPFNAPGHSKVRKMSLSVIHDGIEINESKDMSNLLDPDDTVRLQCISQLQLELKTHGIAWDYDTSCQIMLDLRSNILDRNPAIVGESVKLLWEFLETHSNDKTAERKSPETVEISFSHVLPSLIKAMGNGNPEVRSRIRDLLKEYLAKTKRYPVIVTMLITHGIESADWRIRRESCAFIFEIMDKDSGGMDLTKVVSSLVSRLQDVSSSVLEQGKKALEKIKILIGVEGMEQIVHDLPITLQKLYKDYEGLQSSKKVERKIPKVEDLAYGLAPKRYFDLVESDDDWKGRSQAIEIIYNQTLTARKENVLPSVSELLEFLQTLIYDDNFKISLTSLRILNKVMDILGEHINGYTELIVKMLVPKYADNKFVLRQACSNILMGAMKYSTPNKVVEQIIAFSKHENSRVRSEVFNMMTSCLLAFPKVKPDSELLVKSVAGGLVDYTAKVKYHALEACVVLESLIGFSDLENHLYNCDVAPEIISLIRTRLEDKRLPYLNLEGSLEHLVSKGTANSSSKLLNNTSYQSLPESEPRESRDRRASYSQQLSKEEIDIEEALNRISVISASFENIELASEHRTPPPRKRITKIDREPISDFESDLGFDSVFPETITPALSKSKPKAGRRKIEIIKPELKLPVVAAPEKELKETINQLLKDDEDWSKASECLIRLTELIPLQVRWISHNVSKVAMALSTQMLNLRSSVSKQAIICVEQLFRLVPKPLEPSIESLVTGLLKKIGEGNAFIIENTDKALDSMVANVHHQRALTALVLNSGHRNALIRMRVSILIDRIFTNLLSATISKLMKSPLDCEKLIAAVIGFLREGAAETRNSAKHTLWILSQNEDFELQLPKIVNITRAAEVRDMLRSYQPRNSVCKAEVDSKKKCIEDLN